MLVGVSPCRAEINMNLNRVSQNTSQSTRKYVRIKNTRKVNVRARASVDSDIIDEVSPETIFEYLGQSGNWYKIQYDASTTAYVSTKYSVIEERTVDGNEDKPDDTMSFVRIKNTRKVNIRAGASVDSNVIDEVSPETVFEYLGQEGNWYKIQYNSQMAAYVSTKYSVIEPWSQEAYDGLYDGGEWYDGTSSATTSSSDRNASNGSSTSGQKTCYSCKGSGTCRYCFAGRMYAGGDRMEVCSFCSGTTICWICNGKGYTK